MPVVRTEAAGLGGTKHPESVRGAAIVVYRVAGVTYRNTNHMVTAVLTDEVDPRSSEIWGDRVGSEMTDNHAHLGRPGTLSEH